jgi:hypothetical protein
MLFMTVGDFASAAAGTNALNKITANNKRRTAGVIPGFIVSIMVPPNFVLLSGVLPEHIKGGVWGVEAAKSPKREVCQQIFI